MKSVKNKIDEGENDLKKKNRFSQDEGGYHAKSSRKWGNRPVNANHYLSQKKEIKYRGSTRLSSISLCYGGVEGHLDGRKG